MWTRRHLRFSCLAGAGSSRPPLRFCLSGLLLAALAFLAMPLPAQAFECAVPSGGEPSPATAGASTQQEVNEAAEPAPLVALSGNDGQAHAVLLIGGIYNDYRYFAPWASCLAGEGRQLLGWQRPHHVRPLEVTARALAAEIMRLQRSGVRQVTLFAHSIGGLVAKGAVDLLTQENLAHRFERIDLHAFGTPWGGFPGGDLARGNPVGVLVSWIAGHPVWLDIGTGSPYLVGLARSMPANGRLYHYISSADTVAWPDSEEAARRYAGLLENAAAVVHLSGLDHNAYAGSRIDVLMQQVAQHRWSAGPALTSGTSE